MKRKQNSAEKVKRKLTVWQYQYDNGEAGMLHERKGMWRGEKRIWSDIAYFPNENEDEAQTHVKDLCRRNTQMFFFHGFYNHSLEFRRISFVWYSFWHSKTPHLLDSISYCLTNGVQFIGAMFGDFK